MVKYTSELLHQIEDRLDIKRYSYEADLDYHCRTAYSLAGRWMLASLFDEVQSFDDDGNVQKAMVSVYHTKKRFASTFKTVIANYFDAENLERIVNSVYDSYERCGFFYHQNYYVQPPRLRVEQAGRICFIRGMGPEVETRMSGLGPYLQKEAASNKWASMFRIDMKDLDSQLDSTLSVAQWSNYPENLDEIEYLPILGKYYRDSWLNNYENATISLARTKLKPHRYYLYKIDSPEASDELVVHPLNLEIGTRKWLDIANILRLRKHQKIVHQLKSDLHYYEIKLECLLPERIQNWLEVYSWPMSFEYPSHYHRLIRKDVFHPIKTYLEQYGYQFQE